MKKYIPICILMLSIGLLSCEKDDFCMQNPVTPNLVIRFYDKENITQTKKVERFSIIAESKTDSLFTGQTLDSIAIPLNGAAVKTVYTLKRNSTDGNLNTNEYATLTINYSVVEEYISRSCGYRYIYENVSITGSAGSWIDSISPLESNIIDNQNKAHVQIFH